MRNIAIAFFLFFVTNMCANGQSRLPSYRPKIGLALSGGGAKGISHIGALMVLEKAGIKVDYVVGTSMGSIIGALYAIGYSPDSIAAIIQDEDWDLLLANNPGLRQISIEEKADYGRFVLEMPFEKKRFFLPKGVIDGQELSVELSHRTFPVYDRKKFTDFPIPFKCIATDITNGEVVVLDSGNIADAIRASMAIPSIFTPVKYQGKLLVDGGIVRNFPVQHVKEMGADIIIGVNLSKGFMQEKEIQSFLDILNQSMFLSDGEDTRKQREMCDYLIEPDLTGFSASSFYASDSLIKRGYDAAMLIFDELKALGDSIRIRYGPPAKVQFPRIDSVLLTSFEVDGISKVNRGLVIDRMGLVKNRWYSPEVFPLAMQKVYGTRYFRKVGYELFKYDDGTRVLLRAFEHPQAFFKAALNYNTFTKASLILNVTGRNILGKSSRISSTINISDMFRIKAEYFKYVGAAKNHGLGATLSYDKYDFPVYDGRLRTALYKQRYFAADLKYQIASLTVNTTGFGIRQEVMSFTPDIPGGERVYDGTVSDMRAYWFFNLNTLDRHYYPHKGARVNAELGYVFEPGLNLKVTSRDSLGNNISTRTGILHDTLISKQYFQFKLMAERYDRINKRGVLISSVTAGISLHPLDPEDAVNTVYNNFMLGGSVANFRNQLPVVGLYDFQIRTNNFVGTSLAYQYGLYKNVYIIPKASAGFYVNSLVEYFTTNAVLKSRNQIFGYGLTAGYNSFLGPLDFTIMGTAQFNKFIFYVNLGHNF